MARYLFRFIPSNPIITFGHSISSLGVELEVLIARPRVRLFVEKFGTSWKSKSRIFVDLYRDCVGAVPRVCLCKWITSFLQWYIAALDFLSKLVICVIDFAIP